MGFGEMFDLVHRDVLYTTWGWPFVLMLNDNPKTQKFQQYIFFFTLKKNRAS